VTPDRGHRVAGQREPLTSPRTAQDRQHRITARRARRWGRPRCVARAGWAESGQRKRRGENPHRGKSVWL
jgi:hypothetical protein